MRSCLFTALFLAFLALVCAIIRTSIPEQHLKKNIGPGEGHLAPVRRPILIAEPVHQQSNAHATFSVPCLGCLGSDTTDDEALVFDFKAFALDLPCGQSNLTLNDEPLAQEWNGHEATGRGELSLSTINLDTPKVNLDLSWNSSCLFDSPSGLHPESYTAQLLTLTINRVGAFVPRKAAGFTIAFRQSLEPELLRVAVEPDCTAVSPAHSEDWRNPPADLRWSPELGAEPSNGAAEEPSIESQIEELRQLEVDLDQLKQLIEDKRKYINSKINTDVQSLKEEIALCETLTCILKATAHKANGALLSVFDKITPSSWHSEPNMNPYASHYQAAGSQVPTSIQPPEQCHGGISPPPSRPNSGNHNITITADYHILEDEKPATQRNRFILVLSFFASAIGLFAVIAWIRRRCSSLRRRVDRRADREDRQTRRQYRRAARRQALRDWWYGPSSRSRNHATAATYDEKRGLIIEQETVLEAAMQDEIRQLRNAHDVVNSIVSAEEGMVVRAPQRAAWRGMPVPHEHTQQHALPPFAPPHDSSRFHYTQHTSRNPYLPPFAPHDTLPPPSPRDEESSPYIAQPLSRTSSLPSYRTDSDFEGSGYNTDPPAYETDEDDHDHDHHDGHVTDGFTQYTPSGESTSRGPRSGYTPSVNSIWTPDTGSSVPDIGSARASGETMRTMGTGFASLSEVDARSFL
ncbi:hypothetical protein K402DRAFT_458646 [Aulographum hederae CBS 113979]|uniref:Uncharacterized protein n=1 Tax=Aulographum hederae CBS 113979 TaxID=1176131 RepID=A0A6G1HGP9_9PEZI|nr:hypothetical protein K402DRAFT_458646 [Aulographum hederae CBS 113979]